MYKFKVNNVLQIDLNRIIREQAQEGSDISIVTSGDTSTCLLIVSNEFLAKFVPGDEMVIAREVLSPTWGWNTVDVEYANRSAIFSVGTHGSIVLSDARARMISVNDIKMVKEQVAAARAFMRSTVVKVHTL